MRIIDERETQKQKTKQKKLRQNATRAKWKL